MHTKTSSDVLQDTASRIGRIEFDIAEPTESQPQRNFYFVAAASATERSHVDSATLAFFAGSVDVAAFVGILPTVFRQLPVLHCAAFNMFPLVT